MRSSSTWPTITWSAIIKASPTASSHLSQPWRATARRCDVESASVGCSATIIARQRDARHGFATRRGVGGCMSASSPRSEKPIKTTGMWLFGGLTVLLALGKGMGLWTWSWWHVVLPSMIFLGFNGLYIAVGLLYLSVVSLPERGRADRTLSPLNLCDTAFVRPPNEVLSQRQFWRALGNAAHGSP